MKNDWRDLAPDNIIQFISLANAKGNLKSEAEIVHYLTRSIITASEDLAALTRKQFSGDEVDPRRIQGNAAVIRIYLEYLTSVLGFDLDEACDRKALEVSAWLKARKRTGRTIEGNGDGHADG